MDDFKYINRLTDLMDEYAHGVYRVTANFPKNEMYGITFQLRRAALSVVLNYIEGNAHRNGVNCKVHRNFINKSLKQI